MYQTMTQYLEQATHYPMVPVYRIFDEDEMTPITIFKKLESLSPAYILESVGDPTTDGRYSVIGLDAQPIEGDALEDIQQRFDALRGPLIDDLPPYYVGIVGYLAYHGIEQTHPIHLGTRGRIPAHRFVFCKTVVAFDHLKHRIALICNTVHPDADAYFGAMDRLDQIENLLHQPDPGRKTVGNSVPELLFSSNCSRDTYVSMVNRAKEYIRAGDIFQVVLSQKFTGKGTLDGFALYRRLRQENPAPYLSYIRMPGFEIVCSSPEMLVQMNPGEVRTAPIAGTRAVKRDGRDAERARELLQDPKDRAEHLMLVDLGRNDLGRICRPGTVTVTDYAYVKQYARVMHMVTDVVGIPNPGMTPVDALRATFPAGTVSGAPKLRAMEIIDELEPDGRDLYAGTIILLSQNGHLNSCIAIRTIQLFPESQEIVVQAGGGIVHDSVPEHEYLEILNKSRALFSAIEKTYEGEVRYDFDHRQL